eukprot:TRINITY_DN938_c0_g1_i17.p1 TRINITY_DN938_c0_g1~~TRINITY_DN938_c0_g1_i17.p1  ORF type:complete len:377 (-),score=102.10 TRINITY_DN938_c0_g1_i17:513-1643(-)
MDFFETIFTHVAHTKETPFAEDDEEEEAVELSNALHFWNEVNENFADVVASHQLDSDTKTEIFQSGGIFVFLGLLSVDDADVIKNALVCLFKFANRTECRALISQKSTFSRIIEVTDMSPEVTLASLKLLAELALSVDNMSYFEHEGGFQMLFKHAHSEDYNIAAEAGRALVNLAINAENQQLIAEELGLFVLKTWAESGHKQLQKCSAALLSNLAGTEQVRAKIVQEDGISALTFLCKVPNKDCQTHAARGLANLAVDEENQVLLVQQDALPALLELTASEHPEIVRQACRALGNICVNEENHKEVIRVGAIEKLAELQEHEKEPIAKQAGRALENLSLSAIGMDNGTADRRRGRREGEGEKRIKESGKIELTML